MLYEFRTQVGNDALGGTGSDGLGLDRIKIFVVLADVGAEGDDLEALFAEPFEDDARVEASRVGEDYLGFGSGGHGFAELMRSGVPLYLSLRD